MGRFDGRVAIVVGGGSTPGRTMGNGRAIALRLAAEGARVLVVDRDPERAADTASMITGDGGEAAVFAGDVTVEETCAGMVADAVGRWGSCDVLVNNVGIGLVGGPTDLDPDRWRRVLDVNVTSMYLACRHALPVMRSQGAGAIVNVSSVAAVRAGRTPMVAYQASKAAVNGLTAAVAVAEAPHGIRVNAVMPGLIETPMAMEGLAAATGVPYEELKRRRDRAVPMGRMGTAGEVAAVVAFLASDDASYVTGAVVPVDGGLSVSG